MIVALFVLALAMLIGGVAAIVQGAPFVRLELGWTMVISGSVVMSGGAILAGVAAAVWRLRRIELELAETRENGLRLPTATATLPPPAPAAVPPVPDAPMAPVVTPAMRREPIVEAPSIDIVPERLAPDERAVLAAGDLLPPLTAHRDEAQAASPAPTPLVEPEADGASPEAQRPDATPPEPAAEPETPAAVPAEEPPPRTVVGSYASGGNTYVMFSDGSIEADTPNGKYAFSSLEELKAFAGSESAAASARASA